MLCGPIVFVALSFLHCILMYVVMLTLWSPSLIAVHFGLCVLLVVIKSGIETQGEVGVKVL